MQIKYYAYFESKGEKTEFINILRNSRNDIEAVNKILAKYPELSPSKVNGIIDNFKKYINNHEAE